MKKLRRLFFFVLAVFSIISFFVQLKKYSPKYSIYANFQENTQYISIDTFNRYSMKNKESSFNDIKLIYVNYQGENTSYLTTLDTQEEFINFLGINKDNISIHSTSSDNNIYNYTHITIDVMDTVYATNTLPIAYSTIYTGDTGCRTSCKQETTQFGINGELVQTIKSVYKNNELISEEIEKEEITREPQNEIINIEEIIITPVEGQPNGYDCNYWYSYVDSVSATEEEKQWLKFTMKLESGCNAISNGAYKGLFQYSPSTWNNSYPNDNIFDGKLQVTRTLEKIRSGANPAKMWPAVYKKYVAQYGELSWLSN